MVRVAAELLGYVDVVKYCSSSAVGVSCSFPVLRLCWLVFEREQDVPGVKDDDKKPLLSSVQVGDGGILDRLFRVCLD